MKSVSILIVLLVFTSFAGTVFGYASVSHIIANDCSEAVSEAISEAPNE